jgi:hypothetical protein
VGLIIAYHSFSDYATLQSADITIMFLFVFALALLLGLRFFLVDKTDLRPDEGREVEDERNNETKARSD